jgi:predicted nucleic acid-binding protein
METMDDRGRVFIDTNILIYASNTQSPFYQPAHDANIVATMLVNDVHSLLTHNISDFKRFSSYIEVIPLIP